MANSQLTAAPKMHIDARKFLGNINRKGFAGQIRLVEGKLQKLSEETGSNLRLVSHFGDNVYFENVDTHSYYQADLKGKNNRTLHLDNIKSVVIEDKEKPKVFNDACDQLVDSIEESLDSGDATKAEQVFGKIATGYCTPNVIPECGRVRTWDDQIHHINVNNSIVAEELRPAVVDSIKEAIKNSEAVIKEGSITIGDESVDIPINETVRRVSVARNMRMVAEDAYKSDNFNRLIKTVTGHVSNNNMKDAVGILKSFLSEEQEFTLLDKQGVYTLIENTLYRQGVFNYHAIRNTALLFWETNCHLNKKDIIKEWSTAASKCGNKQLCENVELLKISSGKSPVVFSDAVDKFIQNIFNEDYSTRSVKARSYLNMLKMLNNVVSGSDADQAVKGTVDDLVMRLESDLNNVDDATLFEVEDLLATVSTDLISDTSTLADFNTIPEPFKADTFGTDQDIGDFEGDMGGDDIGGDDIGGFSGDIGDETAIDVEAEEGGEVGEADDIEDIEGAEEEDEEELQLDNIIKKAQPIAEMTEKDVKTVLEALKGMKPEAIEVEGEFKRMLKKGLTESQTSFIKKVMDHSKSINDELHENLASYYYDLVIAEGDSDSQSDTYDFSGSGDIEINDKYTGIKDDKSGVEENIDNGVDVVSEDGLDIEGHNKPSEEDDDKDGDYDDNNPVDESVAVVSADNDEQLLDLIDKVLGGKNGEDEDDNGEVITDEDPHAAALARKDGDDEEWSKEADPDQDGTPIWKDEDDQEMKEDNNITDPENSDYDSEKAADKFGDGSVINDKPKFSDKDYDGTNGANTGKNKPGAGHPNSNK